MGRGKTKLNVGEIFQEGLLPLFHEPGILPSLEMMLLFHKTYLLGLDQGDRLVEVFLMTKFVHTSILLAIKTYRGENVKDNFNRSSEKSLSSL